ncbi:tripartite tricarboxylate transporter substrate-binding protein [Roseomonas sp. BN140053]|uniref:tripartite tricarboxylate transporter substrate-binding protein n=1 Tax=Roseomonas sp. BN140053 TaxID=3391898 RepID=UPI0039E8E7CF
MTGRRGLGALLAAAAVAPRAARAAYPDRPLRLVLGFAPGGTVDTVARILAQGLTPVLGQQVVVENRPGAGANLAAEAVAHGPADGTALLYGVFSHAVAPALMRLSFDPLVDLTAVSQVARVPVFMFAAGNAPFRSIADVVAAARAAPGTVTYASGGVGSSAHLAPELFARRTGVQLVHVPYRGGGPAIQSLLTGDVELLCDTPQPATRTYIEEGRIRALAVMGRERLPSYPDIPAITEAGLGDGLEVQAWQGVLVRSGTPPEMVDTLYRAIAQVMAAPDTRARIEALAVEPIATTPAEYGAFFRSEVLRWTEVARAAGITAQ